MRQPRQGGEVQSPAPSGADESGEGSRVPLRSTFEEYAYLLSRVAGWSMMDLDDLMLEVETDVDLTEQERRELLDRLYRILWQRAQSEIKGGEE